MIDEAAFERMVVRALRSPDGQEAIRSALSTARTRDPDELLTARQAAAELAISESAILKRLARGQLSGSKVGGSRTWRIRRRDLVAR